MSRRFKKMNILKRMTSARHQKMNDEPVGELSETKSVRKRNKARPSKNNLEFMLDISSSHTLRTEEGSLASSDFDIQSIQSCPIKTPTSARSTRIVAPMPTSNGLPAPYSPVKRTPTRTCSASIVSPVSPMSTSYGLPTPYSPVKRVKPGQFKSKNLSRGVARAHSSNIALMSPAASPIKSRRRGMGLTDFFDEYDDITNGEDDDEIGGWASVSGW